MVLDQFPGKKIDRLIVALFQVEVLGDSVLELVGVCNCGVAVEADKIGEIVHAGDVAVGDQRLDGVFVAAAGARALEESLQSGRAQVDLEFAGIASNACAGNFTVGVEGVAVVGRAERGRGGDSEPSRRNESGSSLSVRIRCDRRNSAC